MTTQSRRGYAFGAWEVDNVSCPASAAGFDSEDAPTDLEVITMDYDEIAQANATEFEYKANDGREGVLLAGEAEQMWRRLISRLREKVDRAIDNEDFGEEDVVRQENKLRLAQTVADELGWDY